MNTNEPREPMSTEGQLADADHVDVLVEDLFIEEYPPVAAPDRAARGKRGRLSRAVRPIRAKAKPVLGVLFALGVVAAAMALVGRRRKVSRLSRLLHGLRLAR